MLTPMMGPALGRGIRLLTLDLPVVISRQLCSLGGALGGGAPGGMRVLIHCRSLSISTIQPSRPSTASRACFSKVARSPCDKAGDTAKPCSTLWP